MKIDVTMVKSILDDQYDAVKEFFEKVLTIECSQKILLTRRSYVLYKIFKTILEDEYAQKGKSLNVKGTFYNTHSLTCVITIHSFNNS